MVRAKSTRSGPSEATSACAARFQIVDLDLDRDGVITELLRDQATASVMSPVQERRALTRIASLRERVWAAILGQAPLVAGVLELTRRILGRSVLPEWEREVGLLGDPGAGARDERAAARCALTTIFAEIDRDGLLLRRVLAELEAPVDGRMPWRVPLPGTARRDFAEFLAALRRDHLALEAAKGDLHRANLGLVAPIARRFVGGDTPFLDLLAAGDAGLMQAVNRYDLRCELRFAVVGTWWIRHAIAHLLATHGRLGVH